MNESSYDLPCEVSTPRWRLWLSAISVLLAPLVVLAVVSVVFPHKSPPAGIQTCVLPDGTRLILHQVTYGKRHLFRKEETDWLMRSNLIGFELTTRDESAVLWFYCEDKTGRSRDFPRRSHAVAEDEFGHRTLAAFPSGPETTSLPAKFRAFEVKALRAPSGKFQLRFLNETGESIATFDVPSPFPEFESWTAEPLPTSKAIADGVMLHLDGFDAQSIPSSRRHPLIELPALPSLKIAPLWRLTRDEKLLDDWEMDYCWFRTPDGAQAPSRDCPLSPHELAWEMTCVVRRLPRAEFPADSVWELGEFAIPLVGEETPIGQSRTLVEQQVEVSEMKSYVSSEPAGTEIAETCNDVWIRFIRSWTGIPRPPGVAYAMIELSVFDEQGQRLERKSQPPPVPNEYGEWFQIPKSSKVVRLRVTRNPHYLVKFLVEPPQASSEPKP